MLQIRKLSTKTWKHIDSIDGAFILTKFYAKLESNEFLIVESYGAKRRKYLINEIKVYDIGGTAETFANFEDLFLRLEALKYTGFYKDGDVDLVWGSITGTLSDQIDLQNALNAKQDKVSTAGVERAYIINADGSQGTKATSDLVGVTEPINIFRPTFSQSFGDSIMLGQGSTAGNSYNTLINELYRTSNTNRAVGGRGVFLASQLHNSNINPTTNNFALCMAGFNDVRRGGNDAKTFSKIENAYRAILCNQFLNRYYTASTVSASFSKSGTWTAYNSASVGGKTTGHYSTASGNWTQYVFKDTNVVVALIGGDGVTEVHGTFDVHIDGNLYGSFSLNNATDGISDGINNNARAPFVLYIKDLENVEHTIRITHTNNNILPIDYFGHINEPKFSAPILMLEAPYMNAAGYATSPSNASDTIIDELNALLNSVVNEFSAEYPIYVAKTNDFYDVVTGISVDNIHPNNIGYRQIYLSAKTAMEKVNVANAENQSILPLNNTFTGKNTFSDQTKMSKGLQIQGTFSPAPTGEGIEFEYLSNQAYLSSLNRTGTSWKPFNFRASVFNFLISNVVKLVIKTTGIFNIVLPIYADDTTAGAGGLVSGDLYKTSTGEVRVKL